MSNQNRLLLPHQPTSIGNIGQSTSNSGVKSDNSLSSAASNQENDHQLSVDDNFDSYWEEEARNPHRNRIRIGRQYQATVPQLLRSGEKDQRKLEELETLSFCPKRSAKVSNAELDHYFTVAKSLNLFASLVETRSLLGRDVTIADLNRIRHKEGLSLASVIQPNRHASNNSNISPQSSQQTNTTTVTSSGEQKSPTSASDNLGTSSSIDATNAQEPASQETYTPNLALMKALSHFISLHHPCHHDNDCKKMLKDVPLEDEQEPVVSIKSGNLRGQGSSSQSPSKETKSSRSRSSTKQQSSATSKIDESDVKDVVSSEQEQASSDINNQMAPYYDWTREEVNLFSKAIEVCGKNFGSIKKEFLPSKSVRSIVEYYYIGSREASDGKKRSNHGVDSTDGCSSLDKSQANNNGGGGGNGGGGDHTSPSGKSASGGSSSAENNNTSGPTSNSDSGSNNGSKSIPDATGDAHKQAHTTNRNISNKVNMSSRQLKIEDSSNNKPKAKNIDARMSVYNFDDEIREESSPIIDCPCPGAEVKPLKAKPILPDTPAGSEAGNSNVGSLKFFMDGQLVLKLNACQEQQRCHWVQSGDKIPTPNQRQKRYSKRTSDRLPDPTSQNGSHSNSINDDDLKTEDLTADDEDSKESANSFTNIATPRQNSFSASPSPKRSRARTESTLPPNQAQMPSPIDYNRLAVTNMKERNDNNLNNNNNNNNNNILNNPMMNPWLQANNFAMAAGLFSLFPQAASNLVGGQVQSSVPNMVNMAPRPMDLSVEHSHSQKPIQQATPKSASRSKSKQKHS
uniref:SANT domain-containing protein n=1 Tax=Aceria tosichella TaxID=561515 RepID=A0A6G1S969_9ACAR